MIKYLNHFQIDKIRWDDCISQSVNRRVYAFSWYLDNVSPGWEALVDDDYSAVFPLTHNRKLFVNYLFQPYFTQQLGVFSPAGLSGSRVSEFLLNIPEKFKFAEIQLNSLNNYPSIPGVQALRTNMELDLSPGYKQLSGNYSQNTRRNIKKAVDSGVSLSHETGVDDLIDLFRENFGKTEGKLRSRDYIILQGLLTECINQKQGYILGATSIEGLLSAAAFILFDNSRCYFLFAASDPRARENGAMFFLIDQLISDNAGKGLLLDFEGGNDPNLGRFYRSFGAGEVMYPAVRINRLSYLVRAGLYFARKLRK